MSIRAVIGVGPRTGTSFVMSCLHQAGFPVSFSKVMDDQYPVEGNPAGYFETPLSMLGSLSGVIVKVWPGSHNGVDIERAVILRRDKRTQVPSVERQSVREGYDPDDAEMLIDLCADRIEGTDIPHKEFRTEDLDRDINEIIEYMRY